MQTEVALANSSRRLVPLGAISDEAMKLPSEVQALLPAVDKGMPLHGLFKAKGECLTWLKTELP